MTWLDEVDRGLRFVGLGVEGSAGACLQRSGFFSERVLKDLLLQAQARNQLLEPLILLRPLLQPPQLAGSHPSEPGLAAVGVQLADLVLVTQFSDRDPTPPRPG